MAESMTDDLELLRAYADDGAEDAFRTVVERNLGLVYSSALRQVSDPHLAQEVTQAVFLILARKAGSLRPATVLAGWLFRTTRFAASQALRAARRRQHYEQEAAKMLSTTTAPASEAAWDDVAPFLDEAMASLGTTDRHAILLRFFERKEMKEVGGAIGATEDAAKKRVTRALDKIRAFLGRRGIALSVAALGSALTANAVQAAPPTVSQSITAALAANGVTATTTLVTLTMKAIFYARLKFAATLAALLLIAGGAGTFIALSSTEPKPDTNPERPVAAVDSVPAPDTALQTAPPAQPVNSSGLAWESVQKEYKAGAGEGSVVFSFSFTNTSPSEVVINRVRPGCGCTTSRNLPAMPWAIAAGATDSVEFVMNLAGRSGTVVKPVVVDTSAGTVSLVLRVEIPTAANTNGAFAVRK
jgi:RNA polymerase sigma factor (sigma-70 family)